MVRIAGQDLRALDDEALSAVRNRHVGFVFQRFKLIRGLSVLDNVLVPLRLQGKKSNTA